MTIAEIIAQKKAAASAGQVPKVASKQTAAAVPAESIAETIALQEAVNRIGAGKPVAASGAAKRMTGLILNKDMPCKPEARGQATPVAGPPEERSLSETELQAIPCVPVDADKEEATWHEALNAFESELCVMRDPKEADVIWLAVRPDRRELRPILLHRLPWVLWDHPQAETSGPF